MALNKRLCGLLNHSANVQKIYFNYNSFPVIIECDNDTVKIILSKKIQSLNYGFMETFSNYMIKNNVSWRIKITSIEDKDARFEIDLFF